MCEMYFYVSIIHPLLYANLVPNIKFPLSSNMGISANTLSKQLRATDIGLFVQLGSAWGEELSPNPKSTVLRAASTFGQ